MNTAIKREVHGNVIIPKLFAWSGDAMQVNLQRLQKKPTLEQLQIFRRNVTPYYPISFPIDIFCMLFAACLDKLPDSLSLMTNEQRYDVYGQLIRRCFNLSTKWIHEFADSFHEVIHV